MFRLDPERAHHWAHRAAKLAQHFPPSLRVVQSLYSIETPQLAVSAFGVNFRNPIGVAAGFDKNGMIVDTIDALGFGFCEVGSVSNEPRDGNPKPRLFRLPDDAALINRLGLNNLGPEAVLGILATQRLRIPFGMNIVKTNDQHIHGDRAVEDIVSCFALLAGAGSFVVMNLSCPNTEDGRPFEDPEALRVLLEAVMAKRTELGLDVPVLLKFSPDLPDAEFDRALEIGEELAVAGYVLTNTTVSREGLRTPADTVAAMGRGGLSGRPVFERVLARVSRAYRSVGREKTIIGCGGVFSGDDAYRMIRAGAALIELYTGLVYQGPRACRMILESMSELLRRDGLKQIRDAVGLDAQSPGGSVAAIR